jgi:hypothetical protein
MGDAVGIDSGAAAVRFGRNAREGAREIDSECREPSDLSEMLLLDEMIVALDSIGHS